MKILHLSSEKSWRGGEQQIAYLIEELEKAGIKPIVACRKGSSFEEYANARNWTCFPLPFKNSLDFRTAWSLRRICKEINADIMHLHTSKSHGIAVLSSALGNPANLVLSRRVDFPLKQNNFSSWKYNNRSIKKIICVSDKINEIVKAGIEDKNKVITIHSGIDLNKFNHSVKTDFLRKKYNLPSDVKLIGNTSAIADQKDYYTFVNTAERLLKEDNNFLFFIIGDGPLKDSVRDYVTSKDLQDKIIFTGFLNNIPEILPELDLFLITSKTEGLGTSILDAFASKIPVVATSAGGIPELVKHEKTGLLAPVKDYSALTNEVKRLLNEPKLRNSLIDNAYFFVQRFSKEETAKKTLEVYKDVLHIDK